MSRPYLELVLNRWTWTKTTPQTSKLFSSNSYKTDVIIASHIEMLDLPNYDHTTINLEYNLSHEINFLCDVIDKNFDIITYLSKCLYFKEA